MQGTSLEHLAISESEEETKETQLTMTGPHKNQVKYTEWPTPEQFHQQNEVVMDYIPQHKINIHEFVLLYKDLNK